MVNKNEKETVKRSKIMSAYIVAMFNYEIIGYMFLIFSILFSILFACITSFGESIAKDLISLTLYLLFADMFLGFVLFPSEKKMRIIIGFLVVFVGGLIAGIILLKNGVLSGFILILQAIYYLLTLPFIFRPKIPVDCIWYYESVLGIYFAKLSHQDRMKHVFFLHLRYTFIIILIYSSLYFLASMYKFFQHLHLDLSFIIPIFSPVLPLIVSSLFKRLEGKFGFTILPNASNTTLLTTIFVSQSGNFILYVKNVSDTFLYEIFLDEMPYALKDAVKENSVRTIEVPIPELEPGSMKEIVIFDEEKYQEYFAKNNLDYDFTRIYYRDISWNWYVLYVKLGKNYAVPVIPTIKKMNLMTYVKEICKGIVSML